tara:strand:- start:100 stop:399 length:300 start_codon:yes stop_codon:yes gene_type:complete
MKKKINGESLGDPTLYGQESEPSPEPIADTQEVTAKEPEFVTRLKLEESELNEKATKLAEYLYSEKANTLDRQMQILLKKQSRLMQEYLNVLRERISLL